MSNNAIALEDQFSNAASFPKVKIRTFVQVLVKLAHGIDTISLPADSRCLDLEQNFAVLWGIHWCINGFELVIGCDLERRVWERCDKGLCRMFGRGCGCGGIETGIEERRRHGEPKLVVSDYSLIRI